MTPSPRLSAKAIAELSHRLAIEAEAGIDVRRSWQRETENARGRVQSQFAHVRDAVAGGESLSLALAATGRLLPPLFLEMVHVGEQTGTLGRVLRRLADYYRHQHQLQRSFLVAIAWPLIQLAFALLVTGLLIWAMGLVAARNRGEPIDVLGFGLIGTSGLLIYVNFLIVVGLCVAGFIVAVRRGMLWTRPLQRAAMRLPAVGQSLEMLALARLTWVLQLTMNVEMDLRRVVPLALRATGSDFYIRHTDQVVSLVAAGRPLHEALASTGAFPAGFIDALEVAEESGQVVESMDRLSRRYQDEAEAAMRILMTVVGVAIWVLVALILVVMIFRLANFYFNTIQNALQM